MALLGIRDYIVGTIIKIANDEQAFHAQKVYLNKLNLVLVQVSSPSSDSYSGKLIAFP